MSNLSNSTNCTVLFSPASYGTSKNKNGGNNNNNSSNGNNNNPNNLSPPTQDEILKMLESVKVEDKIAGVKNAILGLQSGESFPKVLMYVIRFCSTHENNKLKKHLMIYWEIVSKIDVTNGKLLPEMILVCNALLNDLNSPNEFIRGSMLRFLCKIKEPELLEPLKDAIKANLTHRHSYVRRNAVMTVFTVYKNFGELLIPDAPELIESFILNESDMSARRNAFLMLFDTCEDKAVTFLMNSMAKVGKYGDGFSLVILELTRKVCHHDPNQKSRFVRCIFSLLNSASPAVAYEAAWTLVTLSSAPTAVRAAAKTYAMLLSSSNDNNIKLIVLDRLADLKKYHTKVLQENLMDIMRVLSSPSIDVCKKVLDIALDLISPRNIDEVVALLKREVIKTQDRSMDKSNEYRHLLIKAIHRCAVKFPDVANQVVPILMDFLNSDGAMDVIVFVRAMCESYCDLRKDIVDKLLLSLNEITNTRVYRVAFWIIGEYATAAEDITEAFAALQMACGELPFTTSSKNTSSNESSDKYTGVPVTKSIVLADGTYATETVYDRPTTVNCIDESLPELRKLILAGDFFLASSLSSTLTKLALKLIKLTNNCQDFVLNVMILMSAFVAYAQQSVVHVMDADSKHRIDLCLKILATEDGKGNFEEQFLTSSRTAFTAIVDLQRQEEMEANKILVPQSQPDELISFRQLRGKKALGSTDIDIDDGADIHRAVAGFGASSSSSNSANPTYSGKIEKVHQLSGFSDAVYAEANVTVLDYDIVLDILVINRTANTLNNLTVELSTIGDLKIVERPQSQTIGPLDSRHIRANIKVSSTETGHIFGTMVFDSSSGAEKTYINLNDIHLDIMDYIKPASCTDVSFRAMWAEFEWENKVAVNTEMTDIVAFCHHIVTETHMRSMTPIHEAEENDEQNEDCSTFLAANLYAQSIFGEDALVNLSVEKLEADGKITGYIRIRSKTQGIALSLGDRITLVQRTSAPATSASDAENKKKGNVSKASGG